jgi:endonuclease/exonuclease/phosphatase family metal-dependent hydrolase
MRRLRKTLLIVLIVAVVAVSYRVLGVYEFRSGECTALPPRHFESSYPAHLTVMTFNIEGHASLLRTDHIEQIASTIRKYNPDIVGINEAHRGTWQSRFTDHAEQLRQLTGLNVAYGRSYRFMGGDFGNAILTRGEILSTDVHKLPGTGEPRSLLEALIRVNGGIVQFYVTHTSAWGGINRAARRDQLRCINAHVQASGHPFILTGDLNAPPESPEIAAFLGTNVLKFAGDPHAATHKVVGQRLDYILTDGGWTVRTARVLDDGPSDHRPVLAELVH